MKDIRDRLEDYVAAKATILLFDKVAIVPTKALRQTITNDVGYVATKICCASQHEIEIEATISEKDEYSYFTYFLGQNLVDFEAVDDLELEVKYVEFKLPEVPKADMFVECEHEWKEYLGLFKTYKDCVKCGKKFEDL